MPTLKFSRLAKKRVCTSGVRVFESKIFPGEWLWVAFDKTGDVISQNGFGSEALARANLTQVKKIFKNRFLSVKTEK